MSIDRAAAVRQAEKLLRRGKLEQAIAEYLRLVEDQPRDWNTANLLGDLYVRAGKVVEGGSTITQQLVRNLYISRDQTLGRKVREACLAVKLSSRWSKQRILGEYLNAIYYGNRAYGAEAAAQSYFSVPASQLTLEQAALLAGLPQAPSAYDPLLRPDLHRGLIELSRRTPEIFWTPRYGGHWVVRSHEAIFEIS